MSAPPQSEHLARTVPAAARPSGYSLALNFLPLLYVIAGVAVVCSTGSSGMAIAVALVWIYLLPPLVCRVVIAAFGRPYGTDLGQESRAYKLWWFLAQWQLPFNRFGALEELLRLVPGLYALWLNLWGARVSTVVYWGPGVMVTDRYAISVGRGAVIGTRAVLAGHLAVKNAAGAFQVTLAPVEIGEGALIGAYAGIGPGCTVMAGEEVPAGTFLRPFTRLAQGRRIKAPQAGSGS